MNPRLIVPVLIIVLILWTLYRRVRRNFGRQTVSPGRLYFRATVLGALGALLLSTLWRDATLVGTLLGGLACGAVLAYFGLRYTQFEATPAGRFYTPHAYIGITILALFIGRLVYRFLVLYGHPGAVAPTGADPLALYRHNPMTLALFGLLIGYYVIYNLGVLRRARDLAQVAIT